MAVSPHRGEAIQGHGGGALCQLNPGARSYRYRCSLPGLAGLTACRRGGLTEDTMKAFDQRPGTHRSRRIGGEGGIRTLDTGISRIHTFQACSFNHSDTSPQSLSDCRAWGSQTALIPDRTGRPPEKRPLRVAGARRLVHNLLQASARGLACHAMSTTIHPGDE